MIRTKLRAPAAVFAVSLALLAAGCSSSSTSDQIQAGAIPVLPKVGHLEKTTLSVAAVPSIDSAGLFVAMNEGLFKQEGLTIQYHPVTSGEAVIGNQVTGLYDITAGNYVDYIKAAAIGTPIQIIAEGSVMQQGTQVVLANRNSHIQTLSGLRGHGLAVNAPDNIEYLLTASALREHDIKANDDAGLEMSPSAVNFDQEVPFSDMAQVLRSGWFRLTPYSPSVPIDAVTVPEPFASQIEQDQGAVAIADLNQGATTQFPIEGYVVTQLWAQAYPNTLKAFLTALEAGQEIADTSRAAVESAFESLPGPQDGQVTRVISSMMALDVYPLGIDPKRLQRVADVMQQFGVLSNKFNIQKMLG